MVRGLSGANKNNRKARGRLAGQAVPGWANLGFSKFLSKDL